MYHKKLKGKYLPPSGIPSKCTHFTLHTITCLLQLGGAYWMAVAGTVCTFLASSLTVFAYKSTKSHKTMYRRQDGERVICVP